MEPQHSKTGYIKSNLFADYDEKLVDFIREKKLDEKHLLLLDSHSSHSFNLHFMCYMKGHGIEVLCFPPHYTHLMQLLDDVPFGALQKAYQNEILEYNFSSRVLSLSQHTPGLWQRRPSSRLWTYWHLSSEPPGTKIAENLAQPCQWKFE